MTAAAGLLEFLHTILNHTIMSEITLKAIEQMLDQKLKAAIAPLATKEDVRTAVQASEARVVKRIDDAQEELAHIIADTVAAPLTQRLDRLEKLLQVEQDVETLKRQMVELRSALHLSA